MIQQVTQIPCDQLNRACGQQSRCNDHLKGQFRHLTGRCCGFHNHGHPRQKRGRHFFQHAPNGEIERIDVNGNTQFWGANMLSHELSTTGKLFNLTIDIDMRIWHFPPPF